MNRECSISRRGLKENHHSGPDRLEGRGLDNKKEESKIYSLGGDKAARGGRRSPSAVLSRRRQEGVLSRSNSE